MLLLEGAHLRLQLHLTLLLMAAVLLLLLVVLLLLLLSAAVVLLQLCVLLLLFVSMCCAICRAWERLAAAAAWRFLQHNSWGRHLQGAVLPDAAVGLVQHVHLVLLIPAGVPVLMTLRQQR